MPVALPSTALGIYAEASKMLGYVQTAGIDRAVSLPARRYVTHGQAVHDCEQVVACMTGVQTGLPGSATPGGGSILSCPLPWQLTLEVSIVRCQVAIVGDDGSLPSPAQYETDAEQVAADSLVLQDAAESRAAEQFGGVVCQVNYPEPSGGLYAVVARYQVAVTT